MDSLNEFLSGFFRYSFQMNEAVASVIMRESSVPEKVLVLFSHTLNAQHIWNSRIQGVEAARGVWGMVLPAEMSDLNRQNHDATEDIINRGSLDTLVEYTNTKGEKFANTRQDILLHVVNHSTYHRGQIASSLKQAGIEPPVTDYIFYQRSRL